MLRHLPMRQTVCRRLAATLLTTLAGTAILWTAPSTAQIRGYYSSDPNVTVDLSVLGGPSNGGLSSGIVTTAPLPVPGTGGAVAIDPGYARSSTGVLLFPPASPLQSRLTGSYSALTPPQLTRPSATRDTAARDTTAQRGEAPRSRLNVPAPQPTAAPSRPVVAAPAPVMPKPEMAKPAMPEPAMAKPEMAKPAMAKPAPAATASAPVPPPPTLPAPTTAPAPAVATRAETTPQSPQTEPVTTSVETAARSPVTAPGGDDIVRVVFDSGSAKLPDAARNELIGLVGKLETDDSLRIQLEAYAQGTSETASQARRLSLSRALAVRSYLIDQGVRSTRMDVRALGNKASEAAAPADRVDARLVSR